MYAYSVTRVSCHCFNIMNRTVMESSPESTYWSSSESSKYSASDETPSPLGLHGKKTVRVPGNAFPRLSQS